jgi:hypothetical protein
MLHNIPKTTKIFGMGFGTGKCYLVTILEVFEDNLVIDLVGDIHFRESLILRLQYCTGDIMQ